jgi:hypothetical protein
VNVRSFDRALKQRPMAFQSVYMMDAANVLFGRMIDGAVVVGVAKAVVSPMLVRVMIVPAGIFSLMIPSTV